MRRSTVVALVLSLIAVLLVSIGTLRRADADSEYEPAPLVASPIAASLSLSRETDVFVGATILAKVATARPGQMSRVDLYDTGRLVDSTLVAAGTASVTLSWVVIAPGPHLLEALVTDAQGQQGFTPSKGVVAFKTEGPTRGEPRSPSGPGKPSGACAPGSRAPMPTSCLRARRSSPRRPVGRNQRSALEGRSPLRSAPRRTARRPTPWPNPPPSPNSPPA
ncbi:MAG TPA: hypothetical protein PLL54_02325 [Dermatophilaceae bacterium]|nr:hypothetical protein [Dermatophilaceae bacterium]